MTFNTFFTMIVVAFSLTTLAFAADPESKPTPALMKDVKRIIFAGDSLTDGSAWCDWVIETLAANGHPNLVMHNAGIAGDRVQFLKNRWQHDVLDLKPDLVILNILTNNREPADKIQGDLDELLATARKAGAKVVVMIPPGVTTATHQAILDGYAPMIQDLAKKNDCTVLDMHAAFLKGKEAGKELWGPGGVHHTLDGWRVLARATLDCLGCDAPTIEKTSIYYNALTDWYIAPPVEWKKDAPIPALPKIGEGFDPAKEGWRKFDRESEIKKTSWWQVSWLARGGIMPMGQEVAKTSPGAPSGTSASFSLAIVKSDAETKTTLHVGGAPGYVVYFNGQLLYECKTNRGYHPDAERFEITLKKGENHILVFSNWLFYVSLGNF